MSALIGKMVKYQSYEPTPTFEEGIVIDSFINAEGLNYIVVSHHTTSQIQATDIIDVVMDSGPLCTKYGFRSDNQVDDNISLVNPIISRK